MKLIKIFFTLIFLYTLLGIPYSFANSLYPAINEVKLPQGQRAIAMVTFENKEERDTEILLSVYEYNPKTDEIIKDSRNNFLKVDTDTFVVKAKEKKEIPYEIVPVSNLQLGTYFNILVLTEVSSTKDVYIDKGISQLVVLHVVDPYGEVQGVTTSDYSVRIDVVQKGIPFLTPVELRYTIVNNSKYVITPGGRLEIFNKRSNYKPEYIYVNQEKTRLYPGEKIEKKVSVKNWNFSDLFSERIVIGNISSGLDSSVKTVQTTINSYVYEILGVLTIGIVTILLIKSLKEDTKKKSKTSS
ncbi:hypothetical protein CVU76_03380 [Candidatus Dojkabacteria bacterium HGW-Dojkabacteria-1]|uniref:Uncharacterized protein n=1 Tax=Candidatus Dojkabacteria bacterium HGW-Dojkabacteria-1 TaxID=2013761 RepID=A0A2N2F4C9_9BACT|nr:MAG: hypothetical protein CVU76_03380 [Candidatus Dojkabacteria bacterium HGW-Dojkabacteria-1]